MARVLPRRPTSVRRPARREALSYRMRIALKNARERNQDRRNE